MSTTAVAQVTGTVTNVTQSTQVTLVQNQQLEFHYGLYNFWQDTGTLPTSFQFDLTGGIPAAAASPIPGTSGEYYASDIFRISVILGQSTLALVLPVDEYATQLQEAPSYASLVPSTFDGLPSATMQVSFTLTLAQVTAIKAAKQNGNLNAITVLVDTPLTANGEGWSAGGVNGTSNMEMYGILMASNGTTSIGAKSGAINLVTPAWLKH
jgi:hypothetical protein